MNTTELAIALVIIAVIVILVVAFALVSQSASLSATSKEVMISTGASTVEITYPVNGTVVSTGGSFHVDSNISTGALTVPIPPIPAFPPSSVLNQLPPNEARTWTVTLIGLNADINVNDVNSIGIFANTATNSTGQTDITSLGSYTFNTNQFIWIAFNVPSTTVITGIYFNPKSSINISVNITAKPTSTGIPTVTYMSQAINVASLGTLTQMIPVVPAQSTSNNWTIFLTQSVFGNGIYNDLNSAVVYSGTQNITSNGVTSMSDYDNQLIWTITNFSAASSITSLYLTYDQGVSINVICQLYKNSQLISSKTANTNSNASNITIVF
jgi:hypothetical protein